MTPSLPVALAILAFLGAPASAAPDFAVMRECGPQHYERYQKASGFEKGDPAGLAQKLELINGVLDSAGSYADSISRPGSDAPALPPGCQLDEAKIKDEVYGGLADLRRKINEKAADALPEEEKEPTRNLTAIEGEIDGAMGEAKSLAELKSKLRGIVGKVNAADEGAPESVKPRVLRIKKRIGAILVRISEKQSAGVSSYDQAIPADVLARDAKRAAEAKKRADAAKDLSFGGDKTDNTPNAAADGATGGNQSGQGSPAGVASPTRKNSRPRGADAVAEANIDHDTDPDEPGSSVLTEVVTGSAKPLGGAVNPSAAGDASSRAARKEAAVRAERRARSIPNNRERDEALMNLEEARGFEIIVKASKDGAKRHIIIKKNFVDRTFDVSNGRLPALRPGEVTPEEEAALEMQLEAMNKGGM